MITIEVCENGWIVRDTLSEDILPSVIQDKEDNLSPKITLLWEIVDKLGLSGTRYDKWRIHITKKHGDKWENTKDLPCEE